MGVIQPALGAGLLVYALIASSTSMAQIKPPPDAPKSWIPERRTVEDGRAAIVDPPLSEAEKREQATRPDASGDTALIQPVFPEDKSITSRFTGVDECVADAAAATVLRANRAANSIGPQGGKKVSREFAEPFTRARELITERKYAEALPAIDRASQHLPEDTDIELALEQLRTAVFAGLGDQAALVMSLERQLALGGLPLEMVEAHCETIQGLYESLRQ